MTINERIRYLRKDVLKMNQTDFAEKIGMKQTSVSSFEKAGATVTEQTLKSICMSVRGLNETWLRDGTGPMYTEEPMFSLDQFVRDHGGTDLEIEIMKAYFELDPEIRKKVWDHFKARFPSIGPPGLDDVPGTPEELEGQFPPVKNPGSQVS